MIWSKQKHKRDLLRFFWCGAMGAAEARNRMHPTQKPSALLADIIERWLPADGLVLDAYAGSGSTVIAAEKSGRSCLAIELDPRYCDVIRQRYADFTGQPEYAPRP